MTDGDGFGMELILGFIYVLCVFASASDLDKITTGALRHSALHIGFTAAVLVFVAVRAAMIHGCITPPSLLIARPSSSPSLVLDSTLHDRLALLWHPANGHITGYGDMQPQTC
jgi:hypothetical protein